MNRIGPDWEKKLSTLPLNHGGFSQKLMKQIEERAGMERKKKTWHKPFMVAGISVLLLCIAIGIFQKEKVTDFVTAMFSSSDKKALQEMDLEKEISLKVMYFHENTFMSNFGRAFMIKFPNTNIRVVSAPAGLSGPDFIEWLDREQPDVLALSPNLYRELALDGNLYKLDDVIKQEQFPLESFHENAIRLLRQLGDGSLYGLAPQVYAKGLFYNKDLFDRYGIDYPTDRMTWDEVLQLAARFPAEGEGEDKVYGYSYGSYPSPFDLISEIGNTQGLSMTNREGTAVVMDSEAWTGIWRAVVKGMQAGYIYEAPPRPNGTIMMNDYMKSNPFLSGQAAMSNSSFSLISDMKFGAREAGLPSFRWGVVTEPVDPQNRNRATTFSFDTIYAVNAKSDQTRAAWELVKYINSEENMTGRSAKDSVREPLFARKDAMREEMLEYLDAFFSLEPDVARFTDAESAKTWHRTLYETAAKEAQSAAKGEKTVEEAIAAAIEQGNKLLLADSGSGKTEVTAP